jgi:hypothetical protein
MLSEGREFLSKLNALTKEYQRTNKKVNTQKYYRHFFSQ